MYNSTWLLVTGPPDNSTREDDYEAFYNAAQFTTGLVLYPIICMFGITGNVLTLVVLSHRKMRTSTNAFLQVGTGR